MPRGIYDRSTSKPRTRKAINIDNHPDAKHGAAQHVSSSMPSVVAIPLPLATPTLYVKVELPDLHGDTVEDHVEWLKEVKDKLSDYGQVREFVVTGMPTHMSLN